MKRQVAVIGLNASGNPDIWAADVEVTEEQQALGDHLEIAKQQAQEDDFEPNLAVDVPDELPAIVDRLNELYPEVCFDLDETEKGHIWLVHSEENWHNAWIWLGGHTWLQISIRPCNYPGLTVNTITKSDEQLAAHINQEFSSGLWIARSCNLEGVKLREEGNVSYVQGDDEES
jgi:hypothetical protein